MNGLTSQAIIIFHDSLIEDDIGTDDYLPGILNIGTLDHLVEYQLHLNNDIFTNAAFALHTIADNHVFNNGNKRTGFGLASIILESERYFINASETDRLVFLLNVANYRTNVDDVELWLRENTYQMGFVVFKLRYIRNEIKYVATIQILKTMKMLLIILESIAKKL